MSAFSKKMDLTVKAGPSGVNDYNSPNSKFGNTETEKTYFFTGNVERVVAWNRVLKNRSLFEVISSVISIREVPEKYQNIILLRDKKGPILQVVHPFHHEVYENEFSIGDILRVVGYMSGNNTMTAVNIRRASGEEVASLKRFCYVGDFAISSLISENK